jgi:hypothetical protein
VLQSLVRKLAFFLNSSARDPILNSLGVPKDPS